MLFEAPNCLEDLDPSSSREEAGVWSESAGYRGK